ncbi:hypothetical protein V5H98_16575 [Georgenia sp. M64]|uniref:hypothetical protein n=1 Tax=Georgenia sp. M64 TaxID=3120520 RepID=UPI0030E280D1
MTELLAFITSLRHPENSANYGRVEALLQASLGSMAGQSVQDRVAVIVGNREPSFTLPAGARFVRVDFPPPSAVKGPQTGREAVLLDKGTKLAVALLTAREHGPTHVMAVDADDFVSRKIAAHVARNPGVAGWYVTSGWRYSAERASVRPQPEFYRHCGTSHIVRTDLFRAPDLDPLRVTQAEIAEAFGSRLHHLLASHVTVVEYLAAHGSPLRPLPFPGALYAVGTGENHSGISMGGLGRPVGARMSAEFAVPPTPLTPVSIARAVLPSRRAFSARLSPLRVPRRRGPAFRSER